MSDEPQVPSWQTSDPQDPKAIKILEDEYFRSNGDVRSMLRVLFNSDFFKDSSYKKVEVHIEREIFYEQYKFQIPPHSRDSSRKKNVRTNS